MELGLNAIISWAYTGKKNSELSNDLKWVTGSYHTESKKKKDEVKIPNQLHSPVTVKQNQEFKKQTTKPKASLMGQVAHFL